MGDKKASKIIIILIMIRIGLIKVIMKSMSMLSMLMIIMMMIMVMLMMRIHSRSSNNLVNRSQRLFRYMQSLIQNFTSMRKATAEIGSNFN